MKKIVFQSLIKNEETRLIATFFHSRPLRFAEYKNWGN